MNRFRKYVYRSWALLRQNPLFSSIYILGTALSVALLMVLFIIFYVKFAPIYPEGNRNRTASAPEMEPTRRRTSPSARRWRWRRISTPSKGLPHLDDIAVVAQDFSFENRAALTLHSVPVSITPKYVDDGFWRVFTFRFLYGKPFSEADVKATMPVAVVSEKLARRLYGTADVVGKNFQFNGNELKIVGVVQNVSWVTPVTAADLWLPVTRNIDVLRTDGGENIRGTLTVYMTAPNVSEKEVLRQEVREAFRKYNTTCKLYRHEIFDQPDDYWKSCFSKWDIMGGIIASRMDSRIGELGIRKAYGASNFWLLRQVLNENLFFTSLGSIFGLLFSYVFIWLSSDWILTILDISYDSDEAGQKATERSLGIMANTPMKVSVLSYQGAKDPDEFIKKYGRERFEMLLNGTANPTEFQLKKAKAKYDLRSDDGRLSYIREAIGILTERGVSPTARDVYAGRLADETGVSKQAIVSQLQGAVQTAARRDRRRQQQELSKQGIAADIRVPYTSSGESALGAAAAARQLAAALMQNPDEIPYVRRRLDMATVLVPELQNVLQAIFQCADSGQLLNLTTLQQLLDDKAFQQIALAMAQNHDAPLQHQDIDMYLDRLENARPLDEKVRQMDDSQFSDFFANMGKKKGAKAEEPEE